jgi:hypothetical protein
MKPDFANEFAKDWIESWNAHDLDAILAHYTDDFLMTSPAIVQITGETSGQLQGKKEVGSYWRKALNKYPDLKLELLSVKLGVRSLIINYIGLKGQRVSEILHFNMQGRVYEAEALYEAPI